MTKLTKQKKKAFSPEEKQKQERKVEEQERKLDFASTFYTTIIAAITFVAGLFWRDAMTEFIEIFLPEWTGLIGALAIAILVTIFIVMLVVLMNQRTRMLGKELEKQKAKLDKEKRKRK